MFQYRDDWAEQPTRELDTPSHLHRSGHSGTGRRSRTRKVEQDKRADGGPVVYDVPEVLRRLSVTRPTIYRYLRSGELRSFRLGSRRLVSAEALAEFIRSRETLEAG